MDMKTKILVIAPVMAQPSEIELFASSLAFMQPYGHMEFLDPLSFIDMDLPNEAYYLAWQSHLASIINQFDAFMGFSFGGVILQQSFSLFENQPIILFSTPTFADTSLHQKLGEVIHLCEKNQLEQALNKLYAQVYYPNPQPSCDWTTIDPSEAAQRLKTGLTRVLTTDSSHLVKTSNINLLHLIGEHSDLVNAQNVLSPKTGLLLTVPDAGMRVLQNNLAFCRNPILEKLTCYAA